MRRGTHHLPDASCIRATLSLFLRRPAIVATERRKLLLANRLAALLRKSIEEAEEEDEREVGLRSIPAKCCSDNRTLPHICSHTSLLFVTLCSLQSQQNCSLACASREIPRMPASSCFSQSCDLVESVNSKTSTPVNQPS